MATDTLVFSYGWALYRREQNTWALAHDSASAQGGNNAITSQWEVMANKPGKYYLTRTWGRGPTAIPAGATINSAYIRLTNDAPTLGTTVHVVEAPPGDYATSQYSQFGAISFGAAVFTPGETDTIVLNANGIAYLQSQVGNATIRLGFRCDKDLTNTAPSTIADTMWWHTADIEFVIDYTPPVPAPTITKVNPATGHPGDALSVIITGQNFTGATAVSFGAAVTVDSFTVDSDTQITANITISTTAPYSYLIVTVTTPSGTGQKLEGFAVLEKYAPPVPPSESAPVYGGIYGPGPGSGGYNVNFGGAGNFLGFLTGWRSLTVKRVVNGPAQATIELDGYHEAIPLLNLDAQVQMWRANPLLGIKAYKECDLLFQNGRFDWDSQAQSVFIATLVGPENLLERRILLGGDDQPYCAGGYSAEQAMKQLVQVQCGLSGMRNLISGAMPGLSVAPNQNRGSMWSGYQLGEKLLTYLQGIAEAKSMALKVTSSAPGQFVFDAYPTPYGADRTASNINPATGRNAAGNTPVIFSQQRGNAAAMSYINKRDGEGNVAIDIDAGLVFASPGETDSPWNHREFAINPGADESTEDYAAGALEKMKATEDIELTIVQTPTCAYGKDYFLGDWVSLYVSGPKIKKTMHKVITSVTWTVRPQQGQPDEQIAIELSSGNIIKRDALQEILANYGKRIKRLEMNQ